MDTNNIFKKYDRIAQGKAGASTPPMVRKIAAEFFSIPQVLEHELLPSLYLPIAKMLEFTLPLQNATITAPQPAQYFSKAAPDITDEALMLRVRRLPLPDSKTVHKLLACSRQCWLDGRVSKKNPTRAALAEQASMMLAMLPWGCSKPPGLSDSEPLYTLWRFAGQHWLAGSQMNDMLELLRYKINSSPDLMKEFRVWGTALLPKILEAHRAADTGTYWTAQDLRWIRDIGDDMVQNQAALITSAHLGEITDEPHWVGVVFDCRAECVVCYGDSLGSPHTLAKIELADLPIGRQEDGFSCGMLHPFGRAYRFRQFTA
ncbi:hypothetical protein B0H10DRAFT_2041596 [Mycena sp. CBHHK59/15]|nr:hypothetical protein B0H10DRAFT_2041596 [Mycena sp. CBHHK59/15]